MKKSVIAAILGVAACAAVGTSYGQGNLTFVNYSFGSASYSAPVTFGGLAVGSDFSATLLYSSTGLEGSFSPVAGTTTPFYGAGLGDTANGGGWFAQSPVTIQSYTTGAAYFEIFVQNTATVQGNVAGSLTGTSGVVVFSTLATAANLHLAGTMFFGDNPDVTTGLQPFSVAAVPEPTTLALAGLGGLASLVMLRRKKA